MAPGTRREQTAQAAASPMGGPLRVWILTRLILFLALVATASTPLASDLLLFSRWSEVLGQGQIPVGDMWQYPPGMAILLAVVGALGLGIAGLLGLVLAADFGILRAFRGTPGARYWSWAPLLMGPLVLTRVDMVVTFLAILGLLPGLGAARSGILLGVGAALKLWPGALLVALPWHRAGIRAATAAIAYGACALVVWGLFEGDDFWANQGSRGLQIESVAAWPFLVAERLGAPVEVVFRNGTNEIASPLAGSIAMMLPAATVVSVAAVAWLSWRRNPTGPVAARALSLVCLLMVTSRVLSPQFNIWILGMVALAVAHGVATRSVKLASAGTALAAAAYYPFLYSLDSRGLAVQTVRVACLIWLTIVAVRLSAFRRGHTLTTADSWVISPEADPVNMTEATAIRPEPSP